jgi:hypothetical protein
MHHIDNHALNLTQNLVAPNKHCILYDSMKHSPSCKTNSRPASQEAAWLFQVSQCSEEPKNGVRLP